MNTNENVRHNIVPPIQCEATTANNRKKLKWLNLTALFFMQVMQYDIICITISRFNIFSNIQYSS